ncbi:MAG: dihydroorotase [Thermodesulfovibrionales bacterium]|nr:dihydroorotase [Thermodesulfovibrionales bacterium]
MDIIIKNGHIIDPSQGIDSFGDVVIEKGKIKEIFLLNNKNNKDKKRIKKSDEVKIIDATGLYILPGLIDMHTHLREPGYEYKETIKTGTLAAIKGGFTSLCSMPNTKPVNDNNVVTTYIQKKSLEEGYCNVFPIGAITKNSQGEELAEIGSMIEAGAVAFSDDGKSLMNSLLMRRALEYCKSFNVPIISHAEDTFLSEYGVMNESSLSTSLGMRGIPSAAEEIIVARDIILSELTGSCLHIAHVSTEGSIRLIRLAKERGLNITAETCPHYFTLTEDAVLDYNTNAKVNPPLRTIKDVHAIKEALKDGTIDVIATDHAPHHIDEKNQEFDKAPFGISGLETALSLSLKLVFDGILSLSQLVEKVALIPAKILKIPKGTLKIGTDAEITIIDLNRIWKVEPSSFSTLGQNTPFAGWELKGKVIITICRGKVYEFN